MSPNKSEQKPELRYKPYVEILKLIQNGRTHKEIAKKLEMPKSTLSDRIAKLKSSNLLTQVVAFNSKVYKLTKQGLAFVRNFAEGTNQINQHNIVVTLKKLNSPNTIKDWGEVNHKTWKGLTPKEDIMQGCHIEVTPENVKIWIRPIHATTPDDARRQMLNILATIRERLYSRYGLKCSPKFKVTSQHIARLDTPLAKLCKELRVNFQSPDLHIDNSFGECHEEYVNPNKAYDDANWAIKAQQEIVDFRLSPKEMKESICDIDKVMGKNTEYLGKLVKMQETQTKQLETFRICMKEHLALVSSLHEVVEEMKTQRQTGFFRRIFRS